MKLFDIVTLSDNQGLGQIETVIGGGLKVLESIFPNIFGGGRKRLNAADWNQLFPGSGYWTSSLRNFLSYHIKYNTDLKYIYDVGQGTGQGVLHGFVWQNRKALFPDMPDNNFNWPVAMKEFEKILIAEKQGSDYSGFPLPAGFNLSSILPYAIGVAAFVFLLNRGKKRK